MVPAALAALLLAATGPAPLAAASLAPTLHLSVGTGSCNRASVPGLGLRGPNPCDLVVGAEATLRYRRLEAGVSYQGREPIDLLTLFSYRPSTATSLGGTVGLLGGSGERWRLSAAGELGWRRYTHFVGDGLRSWRGAADTAYAGLVGRAATGLRNPEGRTDRIEVTVAWRKDLRRVTDLVDGLPWRVGGWSITMGIGVVADW
jgi:hypothetical protein